MLNNMSTKQLQELLSRVNQALQRKREEEMATLKQRMADIASEHGFTLSEVLGKGKRGKQLRVRRQMRDTKTKVIYSGFGRPPRNFDMKRAVPL